jgi:predicted nucleic acid-binding Zn ribbon protein
MKQVYDMDCPNCGTFNPEDRTVCWRCDKELPKPKPQRRRDPQRSARIWLYVAMAVFALFVIMQACGMGPSLGPGIDPTGWRHAPAPVVWQVEALSGLVL